ncbi:MAG: hypothetical protein HYU36_20400 [Planctomycetes bacterium]|nr:hypothetical protein [Planctomycetota bacterium]
MDKNLNRSQIWRQPHFLWVSAGFLLLTWFALQALITQLQIRELRAARQVAEREIQDLKEQNQRKLHELYALQNDPFLIEQRLREETGKTRPREMPLEVSPGDGRP